MATNPTPMSANEAQQALLNFITPTNQALKEILDELRQSNQTINTTLASISQQQPSASGSGVNTTQPSGGLFSSFFGGTQQQAVVASPNVSRTQQRDQVEVVGDVDDPTNLMGVMNIMSEQLDEIKQNTVSVGDYLNPYRDKTYDEIIKSLKTRGLDALKVLQQNTNYGERMGRLRLKMLDEIPELAEHIASFNAGKSMYADQGFERKAFDVFVKTGKTNPKGVPLDQTFRYLPKSIPDAHVKFDGKLYNLIQGGTKLAMKNYRDIERIALKGGTYSNEMDIVRELRHRMEEQKEPYNIIFKSRKI